MLEDEVRLLREALNNLIGLLAKDKLNVNFFAPGTPPGYDETKAELGKMAKVMPKPPGEQTPPVEKPKSEKPAKPKIEKPSKPVVEVFPPGTPTPTAEKPAKAEEKPVEGVVISQDQLKALCHAKVANGMSREKIKEYIKDFGEEKIKDLSRDQRRLLWDILHGTDDATPKIKDDDIPY